jgi:hypothetical protein
MQRKVKLKIRIEREMLEKIYISEGIEDEDNSNTPPTSRPSRDTPTTPTQAAQYDLELCEQFRKKFTTSQPPERLGKDEEYSEHQKTNRISTVISYVAAFSAIAITMSLSCPKYFERLASCVSPHYIDTTLLTPALITISGLAILCLAQYANTPQESQGNYAVLYNQ